VAKLVKLSIVKYDHNHIFVPLLTTL